MLELRFNMKCCWYTNSSLNLSTPVSNTGQRSLKLIGRYSPLLHLQVIPPYSMYQVLMLMESAVFLRALYYNSYLKQLNSCSLICQLQLLFHCCSSFFPYSLFTLSYFLAIIPFVSLLQFLFATQLLFPTVAVFVSQTWF